MRPVPSFLRPALTLALAAGLVAGAALPVVTAAPAQAASTSGSDSRPFPDRVFAPDSFWYRQLPADTPTAPNSAAIVKDLVHQAETHWGAPGRPNVTINTTDYSPPMYVARLTDPLVTVNFDNCQNKSWGDSGLVSKYLTGINIPRDAIPAQGTDREIVIYNADTGTLTEMWIAKKDGDRWSACWGGSIHNAATDDGVFDWPFGVTAAGLAMTGGTIRAEELKRGRIDHVVGLALPFSQPYPTISAPALRTDGRNPQGLNVPAQGQMLRFPAHIDIDSLGLSPAARTIAKAAQDYGIIIWDTAGAVSFRAENPIGMASDPYPQIMRNRYIWQEMAGFPLHLLEVLPMDYSAPVPAPPATTPVADPDPEPVVTPEPTLEPVVAPKPTPEPTLEPVVAPKPALVAGDSFARATKNGWGFAETGGRWHTWPNKAISTSGGAGVLTLDRTGAVAYGMLESVRSVNTDLRADLAFSARPSGGPAYATLITRSGDRDEYRSMLQLNASGSVQVHLTAVVDGKERVLRSATVAGPSYRAGTELKVRTQVVRGSATGSSELRVKVWQAGQSEPDAWLATATDSTPELRDAGSVGVTTYLGGTVPTSGAVQVRVHDLTVHDIP